MSVNPPAYSGRMQTFTCTPAAASTTAVHAAAACSVSATQTITTSITSPDVPRNITATAGGTAADVKAVQVIVYGTNYEDVAISETLPIFTVNTTGDVVGSKAFKTVTSYAVPAMDGTGCTVSIGYGDKLGLNDRLTRNSVRAAYLNYVLEGTAPTVAVSSTAIESNTVDLNSALDGTIVHVDYVKV